MLLFQKLIQNGSSICSRLFVKHGWDRRKRLLTVEKLVSQGFDREIAATIVRVTPFTMTSPQRIAALCDAIRYLAAYRVSGAIVECGVWRAGSMMAAADTLRLLNQTDRELYLFDTFQGMPPPGNHDVSFTGEHAKDLLANEDINNPRSMWCRSELVQVQENMNSTGYPQSQIHYVAGKVEDTLPAAAPSSIALLRLDTDWYESTRCEMEHLFPRLQPGGVLILDDYGHWKGARQAVDQYFQRHPTPLLLHRIDYTGRIGVKPFIKDSSEDSIAGAGG